jgi:hypothetical protein
MSDISSDSSQRTRYNSDKSALFCPHGRRPEVLWPAAGVCHAAEKLL